MSNQRRGGFGHGPRAVEKANDFKGAMKKIMVYIDVYKRQEQSI